MKKLFITLMLAVFLSATTAFAADAPRVLVYGGLVEFADQQPVVIDGRTLVPVRDVFEKLGFDVEWEQDTGTAVLTGDAYQLRITIGNTLFWRNDGAAFELEVPAQIIGGRTMVPLRAPLESLGIDVGWDEATRTVLIETVSVTVPTVPVLPPVSRAAVVATVNGMEICFYDISFRMFDAEWEVNMSDLQITPDERDDAIREEAVRIAAGTVLLKAFAYEHGLYLTAEDLEEIEDTIEELLEWHGTDFLRMIQEDGIVSIAHLERVLHSFSLADKAIEFIIADPEKFAPFEEYMEEIFGAKHILISLDDFDGDEEAAMEFAMEIHARAIAGEDFDELKAEYSQDPGRFTYPDGYTFRAGQMVPEFEEATRELEIGEISDPVLAIQPHYQGVHIILRIEPDPANLPSASPWEPAPTAEDLMSQAIFRGFQAKAAAAEIIFLPALYDVPVSW